MIPVELPKSNEHDVFAAELAQLIESGHWQFTSEDQLDNNFDEWASAAAEVPVSDGEKALASERIGSLLLDHSTYYGHVLRTIGDGLLTTHKYRTEHTDEYPVKWPETLGHQVPYEVVLGSNDYICTSFEGASPMAHKTSNVEFQFNAAAMLNRPGTIVLPYDAPFMHVGTEPTLAGDILRQQRIILRGSDYLKLLPTYLAVESRPGDDMRAGIAFPEYVQANYFLRPASYRGAEIKIHGNLLLENIEWQVSLHTALSDHEAIVRGLPEQVVTEHIVDRNTK